MTRQSHITTTQYVTVEERRIFYNIIYTVRSIRTQFYIALQ